MIHEKNYPVAIVGTVDSRRRFYPTGTAIISVDETTQVWNDVAESLVVLNTAQYCDGVYYSDRLTYSNTMYVVGDGSKAITAMAAEKFPNARRLMCWPHGCRA